MASVILSTLNARFIHASLGLRYLHANMGELRDETVIVEFEVSREPREVVEAIHHRLPIERKAEA